MTVRSAPLENGQPAKADGLLFGRYNTVHMSAIIAHAMSYLTTLWCVQWVAADLDLVTAGIAAYALEFLLFGMKSALWNAGKGDDGVGYAGVGIDALINAGGLLPRADVFLTFPPIAAVLALVGVRVGELVPFTTLPDGSPLTLAGLIAAFLGGILLSAAPHRLWRRAGKG